MHAQIHVDDIGTGFQGVAKKPNGTVINISSATVLTMTFKKPNGTESTVNASFGTDGSDGIFRYAAVAGDLDMPGHYSIQAFVRTPEGEWHSNVVNFTVYPNL